MKSEVRSGDNIFQDCLRSLLGTGELSICRLMYVNCNESSLFLIKSELSGRM